MFVVHLKKHQFVGLLIFAMTLVASSAFAQTGRGRRGNGAHEHHEAAHNSYRPSHEAAAAPGMFNLRMPSAGKGDAMSTMGGNAGFPPWMADIFKKSVKRMFPRNSVMAEHIAEHGPIRRSGFFNGRLLRTIGDMYRIVHYSNGYLGSRLLHIGAVGVVLTSKAFMASQLFAAVIPIMVGAYAIEVIASSVIYNNSKLFKQQHYDVALQRPLSFGEFFQFLTGKGPLDVDDELGEEEPPMYAGGTPALGGPSGGNQSNSRPGPRVVNPGGDGWDGFDGSDQNGHSRRGLPRPHSGGTNNNRSSSNGI